MEKTYMLRIFSKIDELDPQDLMMEKLLKARK